ncbi:major virion structural protein [Bacillus phage vB_BpuM-BpSp]|nr:major virion structural protein [Bacillus phage vB_BpuM-BpSp]
MATVDYNLRDNDKFYYVEGSTTVNNMISTIAKELTVNPPTTYRWKLEFPANADDIENKIILSTITTFNKKFYLQVARGKADANNVLPITYVNMNIGTSLNETKDGLVEGEVSPTTKLSWYKESIDSSIKGWLPVSYWINVTKDAVNMVFRGDPSADNNPYTKFLISYAYIGSLSKLDSEQEDDVDYNFGITTSSSTEPEYTNMYGPRTGTGVTDFCMIANRIGLPYQPHYTGFYSTNPFMDKFNIEGSRWNHSKHQFDKVTIVHPVDMERGYLQNVLSGDGSALDDNSKLVYKEKTKEQQMYKKFQITAPFSLINNSANVKHCVAIRCYNPDEVIKVEE